MAERAVASFAIDLTQMHRRTVTSFYSNLVTRPTGRAVRMGVESQLLEAEGVVGVSVSVLDFSQVRVLDYSCADEVVAKLLLRYLGEDRPAQAYFVASGVQEHHRDAIEAVLERHRLRLVAIGPAGPELLGSPDPFERACWRPLARRGRATAVEVVGETGLSPEAIDLTLRRLCTLRVLVPLPDGAFCAISHLLGPT